MRPIKGPTATTVNIMMIKALLATQVIVIALKHLIISVAHQTMSVKHYMMQAYCQKQCPQHSNYAGVYFMHPAKANYATVVLQQLKYVRHQVTIKTKTYQ